MATLLRRTPDTAADPRFLNLLRDRNPDPEPVRLVMRLHIGCSRVRTASWRVVAELMDGGRCPISVGLSAGEARAIARQAARTGDLPPHTIAWRMQRWVGSAEAGAWHEEG